MTENEEDRIRRIAQELYERRLILSRKGNEQSDWVTAEKIIHNPLHGISFAGSRPIISLRKHWQNATSKDNREFSLDIIKTGISALGLLATIFAGIGLLLTYLNSQQERELSVERLTTERFGRAVEQLGHEDISVRIGGIYALERLAKDSPNYHWIITEVLTAYIRGKAPVTENTNNTEQSNSLIFELLFCSVIIQDIPEIATDIQSALTVIVRRDTENDPSSERLNLIDSNINRANLQGASLQGASLQGASLQGANLMEANLQEASLWGTNLQCSILRKTNLQGAILTGANLQDASLAGANLQGASLTRANLQGVNLQSADLQTADLSNTNFQDADLWKANLQSASLHTANLQGAILQDANLQGASLLFFANLQGADLQGADLKDAELQKAILLGTNLKNVQSLTVDQLEGESPPLLCNVRLPSNIRDIDQNRDCDTLPQLLVDIYGLSLEDAEKIVEEVKRKKWD